MKILYVINTGLVGGLQRHVMCLMESLKGVADTAVAINTEYDPALVPMFEERGLKVYRLRGRSGHDWRIAGRFRSILNDFKPDVIHAHGLPLFCLVHLCLFRRRIPVLHSLHTPPKKPRRSEFFKWKMLEKRVNYWLPVSSVTWADFQKWHSGVKGEVFLNPLRLEAFREPVFDKLANGWKGSNPVVGMVGRNADQKDWPSFHKVERLVRERRPDVIFANAGEEKFCDGMEEIRKMDLFVMTSKHEQLPTTVLECFAIGTPVCGFLPDGGVRDILTFSNGAVSETFLSERSCEKLAQLVLTLLNDAGRRSRLAKDGWSICANHFDATKNCRGQLMDIYRRFVQ